MEISSKWEWESGKFSEKKCEYIDRKITKTEIKNIKVKIEYSILKFIGGPTGFESYYIKDLDNLKPGKTFTICGGTINSWPRCTVKTDKIIKLIKEYKPTNKEKCVRAWEWFRDNPWAQKYDYRDYLISIGKEEEFSTCWGCVEARKNIKELNNDVLFYAMCAHCPIGFLDVINKISAGTFICRCDGSPFNKWINSIDLKEREIAADEMVKLIKNTWK